MNRSLRQPGSQSGWLWIIPALAIFLAALVIPAAAMAQTESGEQDAGELEEIVVTSARRREENIQDVPIAISYLSADLLEDYDMMDLGDVANIVPNSVISAGRATNSTIIAFIRGVGQNDPLWGFEPSVGVYLDDVFIARPQGALLDIYDVKSIEVLRGPQGTLYGKNTLAGAIKYNSRDIVGDPYARVIAEAGSYSRIDLKAAGSTPVTESFYIGGAVAYLHRNGYGEVVESDTPQIYNEIGEDVSNKDLLAGRLNATFLVGDNSRLRFAFDYTQDDSNARGSKRLNDAWGPPLDSRYDVRSDMPVGLESVKNWGISGIFDSTLSDVWTMKLISAYRKNKTDTWIDFDTLNSPIFNVPGQYNDDQFTAEAQFNFQTENWAGVLGAYYFDGEACGSYDAVFGLLNLTSLTSGCVGTKSISIYGDATWSINDQWNLSFGGRWNKDDKTANVFVAQYLGTLHGPETLFDPNNVPPGFILLAVQSDYTNSDTYDDFTPRLSLDYLINDNAMVYFTYSNGFKSGGFNMRGNQTANPNTVNGFDSETVDNYEVGLKTTSLGGDLTFNVTAFYSDYSDVQITTQALVVIGGNPTNVAEVENAGKQVNKGVEIESIWRANDYLQLTAIMGFLNADITEFLSSDPSNPGNIINIADTVEPIFSPDFTGLFSAEFFWGMGGGEGYGRVSYIYTDDIKVMNLTPSVGDQPGYGLLDASIAWTTPNGDWRFALNGNNLTNKEYLQAGYDFGPAFNYVSQIGFFGPPRTFSISATYTY